MLLVTKTTVLRSGIRKQLRDKIKEVQECLSVEGVPSAQHIDYKNIYNGQKIDFLSFDHDIGYLNLDLQMTLTFKVCFCKVKYVIFHLTMTQ